MELFTNQVLSGIATGAIYACMALAVVMIYEAIDHLNFAQGEMAMFSTFIAWQCMQWGVPYWGAFVLSVVLSFGAGIAIERVLFRPLGHASILVHIAGFIALFAIINSVAGLIWDFTIKPFPTPFGSTPLFGGVISSHQAGMIVGDAGACWRCSTCSSASPASASPCARRRPLPEFGEARRRQCRLDDRARLGPCGGDRRHRRHHDRAGDLPRAQHDGRRAALRLRRRGARRA